MNHNMIHTEHFAPTVIRTWIFFSNQSVSKNSFQNRVDNWYQSVPFAEN